jgi:hypothetical protein
MHTESFFRSRLVAAVVALSTALTLVSVAPALASAPVIATVPFTISGPYGSVPCPLWATGGGTRHVEQFSDASGRVVLLRRHVTFAGTLTNMTTGETVPYIGDFTVTLDFVANTSTSSGLLRETVVPGHPPIIAAGRIVVTASFPPQMISQSGQTEDAYAAAICQLTGS